MLNIKLVSALLLGLFLNPLAALAELESLKPLEWKNRILLIQDVPEKNEWVSRLKAHQAEVDDRHIYWFILSEPVQSNYAAGVSNKFLQNIRNRYAFKQAKVLLIGKDGEVKERSDELDLTFFYQQIDKMPMRRMEMLQQSQSAK